MTPERLERVKRAMELSRKKMKHAEIATEMGMSISAVTQLLYDGRAEESVAKVMGRSF
jgi:predicted transcriptional regulator